MRYLGGKAKFAKRFLPIILSHRKPNQIYYEPFVGGANVIKLVDGACVGSDLNPYLISLYQKIQEGWNPPDTITEEMYNDIKDNKDKYPPELVAFVGFGCTFGAKWFGGYGRSDKRNYASECRRSILKLKNKIANVKFVHSSYDNLEIENNSLIYCDPPYANTTKYTAVDKFDSGKFWKWCDDQVHLGHTVFVSELVAPKNWKCVFECKVKHVINQSHSKLVSEKIFTHEKIDYGKLSYFERTLLDD